MRCPPGERNLTAVSMAATLRLGASVQSGSRLRVGVADRVVIRFAGSGSGVEKLAWGQQELWQAMVRQRTWLPMGGVMPLAAARTVDDVADELRYMMSRYQCLRTRLRFDS